MHTAPCHACCLPRPRRARPCPPRIAAAAALALAAGQASAQAPASGPREVPAKTLPVPVPAIVSPRMQQLIAAPLTPTWNVIPETSEGSKQQVRTGAEAALKGLPALRAALKVKVEPVTIDGVKAH